MSSTRKLWQVLKPMRHSAITLTTIQKYSDALLVGGIVQTSPRHKQVRDPEGFIFMVEYAVQIGQGADAVGMDKVGLKPALGQDRIDKRSLVALRHIVKDGREGAQRLIAIFSVERPRHTGNRRRV